MLENCYTTVGRDLVIPIHVASVYEYAIGGKTVPYEEIKYGRENNPSIMEVEKLLACMEGSKYGLLFNSGMASISALFNLLREKKARIAMPRVVYGATRTLADKLLGGNIVYAGPPWDGLLELTDKVDAVIVESIANPTLRVPPLHELEQECMQNDCMLIVDNTFATPVIYKPVKNGASIVVESLTKYIAGHNDVLGGFLGTRSEEDYKHLWEWRRLLGSILQPLEAYLVYRGIKTLECRVKKSSDTAMTLARWLEESGLVEKVHYPGLESHPDHGTAKRLFHGMYGGVVSIDVGSREKALKVLRSLKTIKTAPSLGSVDSIASYPYESSHRSLSREEKESIGITPGLIRLSIGLENPGILLEDLENTLKHAS